MKINLEDYLTVGDLVFIAQFNRKYRWDFMGRLQRYGGPKYNPGTLFEVVHTDTKYGYGKVNVDARGWNLLSNKDRVMMPSVVKANLCRVAFVMKHGLIDTKEYEVKALDGNLNNSRYENLFVTKIGEDYPPDEVPIIHTRLTWEHAMEYLEPPVDFLARWKKRQ